MADHIRKQVRDAVVSDVTDLPLTGTSVFKGRTRSREETALPFLLVHAGDEESEQASMGDAPRTLVREFSVHVKAVAQSTDEGIDDALDAIGVQVEGALGGNNLGGIVKRLVLMRSTRDMSGDGSKVTAVLEMEWLVRVATPENDATVTR